MYEMEMKGQRDLRLFSKHIALFHLIQGKISPLYSYSQNACSKVTFLVKCRSTLS